MSDDIRLRAFALLQAIHEFDVAALREAIDQRQGRLRALGWKPETSDVDAWVPNVIESAQRQIESKGRPPNAASVVPNAAEEPRGTA